MLRCLSNTQSALTLQLIRHLTQCESPEGFQMPPQTLQEGHAQLRQGSSRQQLQQAVGTHVLSAAHLHQQGQMLMQLVFRQPSTTYVLPARRSSCLWRRLLLTWLNAVQQQAAIGAQQSCLVSLALFSRREYQG